MGVYGEVPVTPDRGREANYETVEHQVRSAVAYRPCRGNPCDEEFPALPSRWCDRCLIKAQLSRLRALEEENERLRKARDDFHMDYRLKCDTKTKALNVELHRLRETARFFLTLVDTYTSGPTYQSAREALLSALSAPKAATTDSWQPIETAPTDETLILVYAPGALEGLPDLICPCAYHQDAGFCVCELRQPTHWMPLPSPPKAARGEG